MKCNGIRVFLPLLAALLLTSCLRESAQVGKDAGVGRETPAETPAASGNGEISTEDIFGEENETGESETPPATGTETENRPVDPSTESDSYTPPPFETGESTEPPTVTAASWEIVDGVYQYTIPARDTSGLADTSDMATMERTPLPDQPDDWYPGKVSYNEATGEVTYVWDRSRETLNILAKYNGIYRGDTTRKVCYLTFDCGYEYGHTTTILDALKEKQVPGLFFLTGHYVESAPDIVKRMVAEGHLIGNHTVNHADMTKASVETFIEEMNGLEKLYQDTVPNGPAMTYFRPPKGSLNEWCLKMTDKMGYQTVMWSFAYYDYDVNNQPTYEEALAKVKAGLHPGCVFLFHTESEANASIMGDLIDWIRGQGYEILPLCDYQP